VILRESFLESGGKIREVLFPDDSVNAEVDDTEAANVTSIDEQLQDALLFMRAAKISQQLISVGTLGGAIEVVVP
jgi:hypothetical protein